MTQAKTLSATDVDAALLDGIAIPRRYWAHVVIGLAVAMASMDGSIANVALPNLVRVLHVSPADSIWVVNAYQLSVCMALLIIGSLADIYGYERIFRIGLVLFTAASLACALSHNLTGLAVARFVQGIGGAGIFGVTNAMLRGIYPRRELSRGIGYNTMIVALSLGIGPTVASLILAIASWPWLFAINVPIGIVTLIIAKSVLPSFPASRKHFDLGSAGLSAVTFALLILSIDGLGHEQSSLLILIEFAVFLIFAVLLIRRQALLSSPLLPVDLLRIRLFSFSVGTTFLTSMAQLMGFVAIPFLFHQLGRDQTAIGLLVTPWPVMVAIIAPLAGRLAQRWVPGTLASAGLLILAVGLVLVALLPADASVVNICWRMLLCGLGYGIFLPPNAATQISAVPKIRSGGASSMGATGRVLGQAIGAALVAGLLGRYPENGIVFSLYTAAGIVILGSIVSVLRTPPSPSQ